MAEIKKISTELQLLDKFLDTSGDAGTSGQVLTSTGTGINWVSGGSLPGGPYLPLSAGPSYSLTNSLYISSSGANGLILKQDTSAGSNSGRLFFQTDTAVEGVCIMNANGRLDFRTSSDPISTSGNIKMVLTNGGRLGIGVTSPVSALDVLGKINQTTSSGGTAASFTNSDATSGYGVAIQSEGTSNTRYALILRNLDSSNVYGGVSTMTNQVGFWGIGASPTGTLGSRLTVGGNTSIGSGYTATSAPTNGLIVEGKVGIGTDNPTHKLTVNAPNDTTAVGIDFPSAHFDFSANSTSGYTTSFHMDNTGTTIGSNSAGRALIFQTNNTDRLYINGNTGNVGIGTTSPSTALQVGGLDDGSNYDITVGWNAVSSQAVGTKRSALTFKTSQTGVNNEDIYKWDIAMVTAPATASNEPFGSNLAFLRSTRSSTSVDETTMILTQSGNVGIGTTSPTGKLEIQRSQVTTQFDRDCFLRLHPTATTNSGGFTNIMFGTSTTNNYGVAIGGKKAGTGDTSSTNDPEFSVRILNDNITGTEVLNINTEGNATFAGNINFGDSHFIGDDTDDNLLIQGSANENIIIDSADDIILDAAGNDVLFKDAGTHIGTINMSSQNLNITSSVNDKDIIFKGKDGSSGITALTLDMSDAGKATFNNGWSSDGQATEYTWRIPNTSSNDGHWYKIARVTSLQSTRFKLQMVGGHSYSDGYYSSEVNAYGQLNNDNNYDLIFHRLEADSQNGSPIVSFGQVDVGDSSTDLYVKLNTFAELVITASISNGDLYPDTTSTGSSTTPTNFVAGLEQFGILSPTIFQSTLRLKSQLLDGTNNAGTSGQILSSTGSLTNWVDASAVIGGPYLPLAGGTMTGVTQFNDHTIYGDQVYAKWGAGNDLTIGHDATSSVISNAFGNLYISNHADDKDIIFECDNGSGSSVSYLTLDGSTTHAYFSNPGNVGIGTTSPEDRLDIVGYLRISDNKTANTNKTNRIRGEHYDITEQPATFMFMNSFSTHTTLHIGGGSTIENAATLLRFFTAANNTTTAGTERMRIDSSGNVGIGTTSPSTKLDVNGNLLTRGDIVSRDTYPSIFVDHSGTVMGGIRADATNKLELKTLTTAPLSFQVNSSEKMRITSAGNVGIGATNPTSKLHIVAADGEMADTYMVNIINQEATAGDNFGVQIKAGSNTSDVSLNVANKDGSSLLRVTGNGNVGIGTTSPTNKLHIQGSQATVYSSTDSGGQASAGTTINNTNTSGNTNNFSQLLFTVGTNNNSVSRIVAIRSGSDASDLAFVGKSAAGVAEYMRIKSGGNVGIGVDNPSSLLEVRDGTISGQIAKFSAINPHVVIESSSAGNAVLHLKPNQTGTKSGHFKVTAGNGYNFRWSNDAAGTGEVAYMDLDTSTTGGGDLTVKGDVIAYGSPSDKKYKENIKPIESALDKAMQLQGVTFDWKDSESILEIKEDIGFIAQDVQEVLPELVRDNGKGNLSLRYQGITPILLEAIKELKAEIEELKLNNCNCNK